MLAMCEIGDSPEAKQRPLPTTLDPRDVYSPDILYMLLQNYWELDRGPLGAITNTRPGKTPKRIAAIGPFDNFAIRRAEIDGALRWLAGVDLEAADAISDYYILGLPSDQAATRAGYSESTLYRRINRGVHAMARHLGWKPASERLHPYEDEP